MHLKTLMDPWRTSHLTSEEFGAAWPGASEYLAAIKDSFPYTGPGIQIPGGLEYHRRLAEMITRGLQKSMTAQQVLDEAAEEWNKITKRRRKKRQLEFWSQQMEAMAEAGITYRPELAEK